MPSFLNNNALNFILANLSGCTLWRYKSATDGRLRPFKCRRYLWQQITLKQLEEGCRLWQYNCRRFFARPKITMGHLGGAGRLRSYKCRMHLRPQITVQLLDGVGLSRPYKYRRHFEPYTTLEHLTGADRFGPYKCRRLLGERLFGTVSDY